MLIELFEGLLAMMQQSQPSGELPTALPTSGQQATTPIQLHVHPSYWSDHSAIWCYLPRD